MNDYHKKIYNENIKLILSVLFGIICTIFIKGGIGVLIVIIVFWAITIYLYDVNKTSTEEAIKRFQDNPNATDFELIKKHNPEEAEMLYNAYVVRPLLEERELIKKQNELILDQFIKKYERIPSKEELIKYGYKDDTIKFPW